MKNTFLALVALLFIVACGKEENHGDANVHITGNIKGFKKGRLFIKKYADTAFVNIDTINIDGKSEFESHLKLDSPQMLYLVIDRVSSESIDQELPFFAEPGNITINTSKDAFFAKAKITGSKNQKVYEEFTALRQKFVNDKMELTKLTIEAGKDVKKLDSIDSQLEKLIKRQYLHTANFALNHANMEVGPYVALSEVAGDINIKYLDTIQKSMTPQVAKSMYGTMLTKLIAERKKAEAAPVQ
ncbi:DUF4369 domain-containing protein [Flavobacterium sp. Sd200]|uniref:DUF4369 domain-containing protein n=1 Tax=Flavobacterium sp. Sd200 TaxID=2692211 RepID=UPI0013722218|nr:DUF4369 domain-containing protein [Flavobacterium sp. Sd200]MXN91550.1 DUF4369 domain-containing protein [Flavobacterium sp. Sd200]